MENALKNDTRNALIRRDPYGRIDIGGPIGWRDIKAQGFPYAEQIADIIPGSAQERSIGRINALSQEQGMTPIRNVLNRAEMGIEGAGLVADLFPFVKAGAAVVTPLVAMMARRNGELSKLARIYPNQHGMVGHHASPHKFAPEPGYPLGRFDHSKMGTGEGAQAYGWGTYIAESEGTAGSYYRAFDSDKSYTSVAALLPERFAGSMDNPRKMVIEVENAIRKGDIKNADEFTDVFDVGAELEPAYREVGRIMNTKPNMYSVDLPDEKIAQMLDWDAPLSEQPEAIQKGLRDAFGDVQVADTGNGYAITIVNKDGVGSVDYSTLAATQKDALLNFDRNLRMMRPENAYRQLERLYGSDEAASLALRDAGIPGIRYLDGNSRSAGEGTRNFVVFDENDMRILTRNGESAMPMDEASRMARGKGMGYDFDNLITSSGSDISEITTDVLLPDGGDNLFQGVFGSSGTSSRHGFGDTETTFVLRRPVARSGDWDLDYKKSIKTIKREYPDASEKEVGLIYEMSAEDGNVFDFETNPLDRFGFTDLGEATWEGQRIRGRIAVDQGFDAVAMSDEHGTSYLIPAGSHARSVNAKFDPAKKKSANLLD